MGHGWVRAVAIAKARTPGAAAGEAVEGEGRGGPFLKWSFFKSHPGGVHPSAFLNIEQPGALTSIFRRK